MSKIYTNPFRQMRLDRGLKSKFVAAQIKVTPVFLSQFETGVKDFSLDNIKKIFAFYKRATTRRPITREEKKAIVNFILGEKTETVKK